MSRVSKWKPEKTKVKVVFRLQFHATHVPQTGWDKLFISFIPADSGKATAKTTKANVRNGTCKWADPIYETTRLLQDSKTKQCNEKLYKIVVAMGSSRSGTLGEATINLAEYIDGLKPYAVTLPLHGCNFGTVLHMTVQLLTSKTGFREFEQQRELRENGIQSEPDRHGPAKISLSEDASIDRVDKGSSRIKYTEDANELPPLEEESNLNEEYADSATSGSFHADKHGASSPHEIDSLRRTISGDLSMLSQSQSPHAVKEDPSIGNNELAMAFEENSLLKGSLELAESSLFNLKLEVSSLQTLANELGFETQRISQHLASEISTSKELTNEISVMKLECLKFKDDIIKLQDLRPDPQIPTLEKNQVDHLVGVVESKIREVLSKSYLVPHDIEAKFIYSEFEALLDFLQDFKLRNDGTDVSGNELGLDLCQPESILKNLSMVPPISEAANQKIIDLVRELDDAKIEKEALNRKANQMECYYEALIHELEEDQKRLLIELQHSREEHSTCLYTLSLNKSETESLCRDMNQKMLKFVEERRELEALNKELEIRATTSEAALRRARLNYSIAVDKLQKDLQVLSSQVVSMFETNENLIKQALPESQNQRSVGEDILLVDLKRSLSMQEENYKKVKNELTEMCSVNLNLDIYSRIMQESLRESDAQIKIMKGKMDVLLEELELSNHSQNRLMIRLEKATNDIHALSEYKSSAISQCSDMAFENQLLEDKLANACEENYLLVQKVKDLESKYGACLALLKQEGSDNEKVKSEMSLLKVRLMKLKDESEELVSSKENLEESINFVQDKLVKLLASYDTEYIHTDNLGGVDVKSAILQLEEMQHNAHMKYCELLDENQNLKSERAIADESINFVRDKLVKLLASYNKEIFQVDLKDAILQFEEIQHNEHAKYCELLDENQNLKDERAVADVSLDALRLEVQTMKQKLRYSFEGMVTKLYVSSALVDKLQVEIESVANKLHLSSETEEKYSQFNKVLLGDLAVLEDQMQELSCKNGHLSQEVSGLDALSEELERNGLTISELMHDKQELALCLQEKTEESMKLSSEISCLKETLKSLHKERTYRDELEGKIRDLTLCLNEEQDKLLDLEQRKAELIHVKELVSDLELEKSRLAHLLDQQNVFIEELKRNNSHETDLESQLLEMHNHSLVLDVKIIYVANHYEAVTEELVQKLMSSDVFVRELQEEKANLLSSLESLRSDFNASEAQNKLLLDSNNEIKDQVEECRKKLTMMENNFSLEISISKEELEISVLVLRNKIQELSDKLSKQVLKTEKYKNLSTHFEELKDKAEAECLLVRGKREAEAIAKDSLRIAFIRDQCETQVQELKHQVSISKKHGEELLLKLQDAIDEIENRKKSEAVNMKKKEELLQRISALEAEKREKTNIYDRTKAELECALLSLECCKEEKEKLGKSLMEFEEEKSQLEVELSSVKGQWEDLKFSTSFRMNERGSLDEVESITRDVAGSELLDMEESPQSEDNSLDVDIEHSGAQRLRSSMEHLHEELEKMKNENKVFNTISHDAYPGFQDLQREIIKLHKANEELGSMFPPFSEFSGSGNALERVLALEIELAEALKTKNKSNTNFQSSFLKQHSDAEAIFKSFKDINELIREMLEVKERHSSLEAELVEMHDRYSQLSLRFAEVEGEREKLKMTLKNVRPTS